MEKNKTSRYLKYAIGEIVLVVIGILIALSINNWNEGRKSKLEEKELYLNIIKYLEEEHILLEGHLGISESPKTIFRSLYEYANGKVDSLVIEQPVLLFQSFNFSSLVVQNHENSVESISIEDLRTDLNKYLILVKELAIRPLEEVEDVKLNRRPFLLDQNIIDLDKIFYDTTESSSIDLTQLKTSINLEAFKTFMI